MTPHRYTFKVQVGKGKGSYTTKYAFHRRSKIPSGMPLMYFYSINVHSGHKKRLIRVDNVEGNITTLERVVS